MPSGRITLQGSSHLGLTALIKGVCVPDVLSINHSTTSFLYLVPKYYIFTMAVMTEEKHNPIIQEKGGVELYETISASSESEQEHLFDEKATARLVRKIDLRLLPFLALLYLLSFLDRTNIGNARLAGLEKSLKMEGLDYNVSFRNGVGFSSGSLIDV